VTEQALEERHYASVSVKQPERYSILVSSATESRMLTASLPVGSADLLPYCWKQQAGAWSVLIDHGIEGVLRRSNSSPALSSSQKASLSSKLSTTITTSSVSSKEVDIEVPFADVQEALRKAKIQRCLHEEGKCVPCRFESKYYQRNHEGWRCSNGHLCDFCHEQHDVTFAARMPSARTARTYLQDARPQWAVPDLTIRRLIF